MDDLGLQQTPLSPATASATAGQPSAPPVQPETPVITPPKKKFPFKPVIGTLVALLLVGGTVFLSRQLIQQRQTVEQQAAGVKCKDQKTPKDCNGTCSVPKKNGKQFACKWHYPSEDCNESGKECEGGKPPLSCDIIVPCGDNTYQCGGYNGNERFCLANPPIYTCQQVGIACKNWNIGTCPPEPVTCYYCPNQFEFLDGCPGSGFPTADPPGGVHYDKDSCSIKGNWCGLVQCDHLNTEFISGIDNNCDENPPASPPPLPTIPDCTSLTTTADLNNLKIGTEYSFQLTAGGTAPITGVRMSTYGNSCSDNPSDDPQTVAGPASGPGTYTIKWTPAKAGPFTAYGRIWNDGIAECRADCVDGPPRYLCPNAQACKLTGTVITDSIMSCVDLTKSIVAPKLNDTVTFTCQGANFSSVAPVAQFRTSFDGGVTFNNPTSPKPINLTTNQATEQFIISQIGDWEVQCRVCTNNTTTACTTWGKAL